MEDLLSVPFDASVPAVQSPVRLLDVGTGASAIFPLLGRALHSDWRWVATEADAESAAQARANVERNGWAGDVEVKEVDGSTVVAGVEGEFDAVVCNPPFFASVSGQPAAGDASAR